MKVYGNNCNSGSIHRNVQPEYVEKPKEPEPQLPVIAPRPQLIEPHDEQSRYNGKAVMCVETGRVYKSIKLAAEAMSMSESSVRIAASPKYPGQKSAGGYHWEYV